MPPFACLSVPLFPLAARLRSEPELREHPLAITSDSGGSARIVAASRRARRAGVRPGMTLPQARALLPCLVVRSRDPSCERTAQEALLEAAESVSPRIEDTGDGVVFVDLAGLDVTGSTAASPEVALGHRLIRQAARADLPVRAGIAWSQLAARVAAELPETPHCVPRGREAAFLAPLPLSRLDPEAEVLETLRRWGVRSIGDLARLPARQVASRLGASGHALHLRARGLDPRPLVPYHPPSTFQEGLELEWPLVRLEPLLFVARSALERLCRRLARRGLACAGLEVVLPLEPRGSHRRRLRLPSPTREVRTLLTLLRLDLEAHPPGAPVCGCTLLAHPDRPREVQLSLFGPAVPSPDRLATALARLTVLLGKDRMGAPRRTDRHRPEGFELEAYAPPSPPDLVHEVAAPGRGLLAVRVLRPPLPLAVQTTSAAHGSAAERPLSIRSAAGETAAGRLAIRGRVRVASGPWALEDTWWNPDGVERDYWDVELAGGELYRIYRCRRHDTWWADGIYD